MKKKTVLVTGASQGIGKATATLFATSGYQVIINYCRSQAAALQLQESLSSQGYNVTAIQADVSQRPQVEKMFSTAQQCFGGVDILVNNAAISMQHLFTDISQQQWDKLFAVNVKGVFHCCQCALPYMIHNKQGRIINISSIWGISGASCESAYSASKAAVIGLSKALAKELGPSNVTVNCIAPGVIDTQMNANLDTQCMQQLIEETPLQRIGTPEEIAQCILFLASENAGFITGQVISPNGGMVI